ncbi:MAG: hypothetical protein ACRDT0_09040 [Pseudonocardiaceae bacterium]
MSNNTYEAFSLGELRAAFEKELVTNKRAAAETAYALAFRYRNEDVDGSRHFNIAGEWARKAIDLLEQLPSDTIEQVVSTRTSVGGFELPELLHADVVRARLADVL